MCYNIHDDGVKIHGGNDVLEGGHDSDTLNSSDVLLFKGKGNGCCVVGLVGGEEGPAATFGVTATRAVVGMAAVVVWKHWFYQRWSNLQSRFTVATMFWRVGMIPSTAVMCCCLRGITWATGCNRLKSVQLRFFESMQLQPPVQSSSVFGLFSVAWTGLADTTSTL